MSHMHPVPSSTHTRVNAYGTHMHPCLRTPTHVPAQAAATTHMHPPRTPRTHIPRTHLCVPAPAPHTHAPRPHLPRIPDPPPAPLACTQMHLAPRNHTPACLRTQPQHPHPAHPDPSSPLPVSTPTPPHSRDVYPSHGHVRATHRHSPAPPCRHTPLRTITVFAPRAPHTPTLHAQLTATMHTPRMRTYAHPPTAPARTPHRPTPPSRTRHPLLPAPTPCLTLPAPHTISPAPPRVPTHE
ncbi:hypothetical protein BU17DRAFT_79100 [Hysterangium stoloniferum]|nr:hypothetical protein BU17DRAFT_79100 [Hysterangium stoloniferum]